MEYEGVSPVSSERTFPSLPEKVVVKMKSLSSLIARETDSSDCSSSYSSMPVDE